MTPQQRQQVQDQIRQQVAEFVKNRSANMASRTATGPIAYTIPVVVHIIYKSTNQNVQDVSDARVREQIDQLNDYFQKDNADAGQIPGCSDNPKHYYGDDKAPAIGSGGVNSSGTVTNQAKSMEIAFKLATRDDLGNCTTGITHTSTMNSGFPITVNGEHALAAASAPWPKTKYLNIYVADLRSSTGTQAGAPSGWATLARKASTANYDWVVLDYRYFGTTSAPNGPLGWVLNPADTDLGNYPGYNQGRVAAHEVGHYFDLQHIWGDNDQQIPALPQSCTDDDGIADTPYQLVSNQSPYISNNPPGAEPPVTPGGEAYYYHASCTALKGDMYMNFMDYLDNRGMNMFTLGQKDWAHTAIRTFRSNLYSTGNVTAVFGPPPTVSASGPYCCPVTSTKYIVLDALCFTTTTRVRYDLEILPSAGGSITFGGSLTTSVIPTAAGVVSVPITCTAGEYTKNLTVKATYLAYDGTAWVSGKWSYVTPSTSRVLTVHSSVPAQPASVTSEFNAPCLCTKHITVGSAARADNDNPQAIKIVGPVSGSSLTMRTEYKPGNGGSTTTWAPDYVDITTTNACGTSTSTHYTFTYPMCSNCRGVVTGNSTPMKEGSAAMQARLTISPNPATSEISFAIGDQLPAGRITIKTLTGTLVRSFEVLNANSTFDTRSLRAGAYLVEFRNAEQVTHQTLVVQH